MFRKHSPPRIKVAGYKRDDCTVNAIANGIGISYDLARKILQTVPGSRLEEGETLSFRKRDPLPKSEFYLEYNVKNTCRKITEEEIRPLKEDKMLLTLSEFAEKYNKGRYIVLVTGHLTAVNDGVIYDTWNPKERKVQYAYRVDTKKSKEIIKDLAKYYRMAKEEHFADHLKTI